MHLHNSAANKTSSHHTKTAKGVVRKAYQQQERGFGTTPSKQKVILKKFYHFLDRNRVKNKYIQVLYIFSIFLPKKVYFSKAGVLSIQTGHTDKG